MFVEMPSGTGEKSDTDTLHKSAQRYLPLLSVVLAILLLVGHSIPVWEVSITWQMVALLGLIAFIPYIPDLDWIQVGNMGGFGLQSDVANLRQELEPLFEDLKEEVETNAGNQDQTAETDDTESQGEEEEEDVNDESIEESPRKSNRTKRVDYKAINRRVPDNPSKSLKRLEENLYSDLKYNPRYALLGLRAALDSAEKQYLESMDVDVSDDGTTHIQFDTYVRNTKELPQLVLKALQDTRSVCNKAAHGEEVDQSTAVDILDMGTTLLRYLESMSNNTELEFNQS